MTKKYILAIGLFIVCTLFALNAYTENISKQKKQEDKALTIQPAGTNFDPFKQLREEVANIAASALPVYLAKIPKERISDFGFQSPEELPKAILLPPISLSVPVRKAALLNRIHVEKSLAERPITWIIPISVGERIACLIHIDSIDGKKPEAVMFGDNYRAKRLESGLRLFGWPNFSRWQDLRFLSFYEPTVDLLLVQEGSGQWSWLNLKGTLNANPIPLDANGIDELIGIIKNTKTDK